MNYVLLIVVSLGMMFQSSAADEKFAGAGILCQSKKQKFKYAAEAPDCSKENQEAACMTKDGIAEPLSCKLYKTDSELDQFFVDNQMKVGLECFMKMGGIGFRFKAPECSEAVQNDICNPEWGKVVSCKDFGKDLAGLTKWTREHINTARVSCKIELPAGVPNIGNTYEVPARDCGPISKAAACGSAKPLGCVVRIYG